MRFGQLFAFFSSAADYAKLDVSADAAQSSQHAFHRTIVRCGKVGALIGFVVGIVGAIAMYTHPSHESLHSDDIYIIILSPFMLTAAGMLGGASLASAFAPTSFLMGPIGARWMKLVGTTKPGVARFVSSLVAVLVVGLFIFLAICVAVGKV